MMPGETYEVTGSPGWYEQFRQRLGEAIETGGPSLDAIARSLAVSRRTVQRRLADRGTTWRAELDSARRCRAQQAREAGATGTKLARELGYADPRSVRRALRRWNNG
jgi:AraC-like DNA-binding protein